MCRPSEDCRDLGFSVAPADMEMIKGFSCRQLALFILPQVNAGNQPGADLGPLISPEAKQRVCDLVQSGVDEGAKVSKHVGDTPSCIL